MVFGGDLGCNGVMGCGVGGGEWYPRIGKR